MERRITDDLEKLKAVLPEALVTALEEVDRPADDLLEVILDLGRVPTARFVDGEVVLANHEITADEIEYVEQRLGAFDDDNRAGIERTLHRISAIRNRRGDIVGLTCRVGRAVYGTIDIIQDIIEAGNNVLLLGPPGVGKTTILREAARVLAESRRVVIVDTSNEIGGDGDVPHPAVGRARRMQVAKPLLQHEVMIEAVENHNPEVIVIDEIGRELEAMAARTIAERGVQLIATAHGNTLENLLLNPTLSDLVGGIESVTLSDEEARRRGTQKTVLERRAPPTFDVLVEIQDRQRVLVRDDVAQAVDALLRGRPRPDVLRYRDEDGQVRMEQIDWTEDQNGEVDEKAPPAWNTEKTRALVSHRKLKEKRIYAFGIARNRLIRAAQLLHVPVRIVDNLGEAHVLVTSKQYYRKRPHIVLDAESRNIPVYALRASTGAQMESFLIDLFKLSEEEVDPYALAMQETESAIQRVLGGEEQAVDLAPQNSFVRRTQHEMAEKASLASRSHGKEPYRSVRVFRDS